ncbi:MAG: IS21 family transposase [Symbiobacteriaceae bacterium]|nr:IS21 family transposase [Symbiobacteriaceae bacterium]
MTNYREMLRLKSLGLNHSQIAESMGVTRQTVANALRKAADAGLSYQSVSDLNDREVASILFPPASGKPHYKPPDCEWIHGEMAKRGVTLQLLWIEYCEQCRSASEHPYQITQFKKLYQDYVLQTKATMRMVHKPGETIQVDWAGGTADIIDDETGECIKAYIFVAALPYSGYAYCEAFLSMDIASWVTAHVHMFSFYGGASRILVTDNLKTGVTKNTRDELVINRTYQEMAEHYQTAVIPTRIKAPKDKAAVENAVGSVTSFILASLRNERFFSLHELNAHIKERLNALNHKAFQKKEGSRATGFAEERQYLIQLPSVPFEIAEWKVATVQFNYHVSVASQFYSVPFDYIGRKVDVRVTHHAVEVFFEGSRICSHLRIKGRPSQYSTQEEHMPPKHREALQWNGDRFRRWAAQTGPNTAAVVTAILAGYKVEQQGYRTCMALLNLGKQYSGKQLEMACSRALAFSVRPSYKTIQTILKSAKNLPDEDDTPQVPSQFGFTRGAEYYERRLK